MRRIKIAVWLLVSMILFGGCGKKSSYSDLYDLNCPDGYMVVQGVRRATIQVPEYQVTGSMQLDSYSGQELDASAHYIYQDENSWTAVCLNEYVTSIGAGMMDDPSFENAIRGMELTGDIRITNTSDIRTYTDTHTGITKTSMRAQAQGLFSTQFFGDFVGTFSYIVDGENMVFLFSGTPGVTDDSHVADSLLYMPYNTAVNAPGPDEPEKGTGTEITLFHKEYPKSRLVNMYASVIGAHWMTDDDKKALFQLIYAEDAPEPGDGFAWACAEIALDACGYDISTVAPTLQLSVHDMDGNALCGDGRVYWSENGDYKGHVMFRVPVSMSDVVFQAGNNKAQILAHIAEGDD